MRERDFGAVAASAVAWGGAVAFLVCLLVRKVAPYPRWDLLTCLAVSAGAALLWWVRVRRAPAGSASGSTSRPIRPASLRHRGNRWWPARRGWHTGAALTGLALPFVMLALSAEATTSQVAAIAEGGARITSVTVQQVHSTVLSTSKNESFYSSSVSVTIPRSPETRPDRSSVRTQRPPEPGDDLWGLYSPADPAAGIVLNTSRDELDALLGGPASRSDLLLVAIYGIVPVIPLALARKLAPRPDAPKLSPDTHPAGGPGRMLRVQVDGPSAGRYLWRTEDRGSTKLHRSKIMPALRLRSSDGGRRDLLLDRCLDPQALAALLDGAPGRLYWAPSAPEDEGPDLSTQALLVLDDGRYVRGRTRIGPDSDLPRGEPIRQPLPDPRPTAPVGPYHLWQPEVHRAGVVCYGLGFLAVCAIASGAAYGSGGILTLCLAVAALAPGAGLMLIGRRRTRRLGTLQQRTDGVDAAAPDGPRQTLG